MDKPKRSYYLPAKVVAALDRETERLGLVKERVVAAAILHFLQSGPEPRHTMMEKLDAYLRTPGRRRSSDTL